MAKQTLKTSHVLLIFIPAILIAVAGVIIKMIQFDPLVTNQDNEQNSLDTIPILAQDPIIGKKSAAKTIIVFEDLSCEGCKQQHALLTQIVDSHPDTVKIVVKGLPVKQFPIPSRPAHRYAFCAQRIGEFDSFTSFAFANYQNLNQQTLELIVDEMDIRTKEFTNCLSGAAPDDHLDKTEEIAKALGIQSVPAIFVDNTQVSAPYTLAGWEALLNIN